MADSEHRPPGNDRSLGDLIKDFSQQVSELVRGEVELARTEMTLKTSEMSKASKPLVVAALMGLFGLGALTAAIIIAVALALPAWLAALIVAVAYFIIAGVCVLVGRSHIKRMGRPVPEQMIETLKEDVTWLKERRTKSAAT